MVEKNPYIDLFESAESQESLEPRFKQLCELYDEYLSNGTDESLQRFRQRAFELLNTLFLKDLFQRYLVRKSLVETERRYAQIELQIISKALEYKLPEDTVIEKRVICGVNFEVNNVLGYFLPKIQSYIDSLPETYQRRVSELISSASNLGLKIVVLPNIGANALTIPKQNLMVLDFNLLYQESLSRFFMIFVHELIHFVQAERLDLKALSGEDVDFVRELLLSQEGFDVDTFTKRRKYIFEIIFELSKSDSGYLKFFTRIPNLLALAIDESYKLNLEKNPELQKKLVIEMQLFDFFIRDLLNYRILLEAALNPLFKVFPDVEMFNRYFSLFEELHTLKKNNQAEFDKKVKIVLVDDDLISRFAEFERLRESDDQASQLKFILLASKVLRLPLSVANYDEYFAYLLQNYYLPGSRVLSHNGESLDTSLRSSQTTQRFDELVVRWHDLLFPQESSTD